MDAPSSLSSDSRTAFVTGGTGFVGSHLVEELLRRGYRVRALVRKDPKWLEGLDVETVTGDLFDREALRRGMSGASAVFHVAGLTRAPDYAALERANVDGTLNVLEAAAAQTAAPRVLVTSSLAAVGPSDRASDGSAKPRIETALLRPISDYGRSKAAMERQIKKWQQQPGNAAVPLVVVRPPAVYGPREADIFTLFKTASRGLFPIIGDGQKRQLSLVHVRDLVRGMVDALESEAATGRTYFLSSARGYSWDEVREAALQALGRKALRVNVPRAARRAHRRRVGSGGARDGELPAAQPRKSARGERGVGVLYREGKTGFRLHAPGEPGYRHGRNDGVVPRARVALNAVAASAAEDALPR